MRAVLTSALATLLATSSLAGENSAPDWVEDARRSAASLGGQLQQALREAIAEGGPVAGVEICKIRAPMIAENVSGPGIEIGRSALQIRNPDNAPDHWEARVMSDFQRRLAAGEAPGQIETFAVRRQGDRRVGHWMKAIPMQGLCTVCHGSDLDPEVAAAIDAAYPEDQARGFSVGELRGAFTVVVDLEEG